MTSSNKIAANADKVLTFVVIYMYVYKIHTLISTDHNSVVLTAFSQFAVCCLKY